MDKFSKGDYIHTIPLATVFVKKRFRDEDTNKLWYKVATASGSIYYVQKALTKRLATEVEINLFKTKRKQYEKQT